MEKIFSASEVRQFCYCRLQWYYGRRYGAKQLNEWRRERNAEAGQNAPEGESSFERGQKFHRGFDRRYRIKRVLRRAVIIAAVAVFLFFLFARYGGGPWGIGESFGR